MVAQRNAAELAAGAGNCVGCCGPVAERVAVFCRGCGARLCPTCAGYADERCAECERLADDEDTAYWTEIDRRIDAAKEG